MPLRMEGAAARLRWGYRTAADLGAWQITAGYLRAAVTRADPYQLAQSPLYFVVENTTSRKPPFERLLLDVRVAGATVTARLGPRKG